MKKHRKHVIRIFSLLLAAVLLLGPLSLGIEAKAADTVPAVVAETVIKKGTTTASYLFVRSGAGTKYNFVGGLWRGTAVDILEEKDGWYRISSGWISAKYVKTADAAATAPTPTPPAESKVGNAVVTASLLFIRKDPSTNYSAVGMLRKGDRITVLESNGNWLKIKDGWVYSAYVTMDSGTTVYDNERTNAIVTANALNIRETPGLSGKVVGSLTRNQKVEILETSGDWMRISSGWINKNHVKLVDSSVTSHNTGTVKASLLRVRSGPGTSHEQVGSLWFGEKVIILENRGDWLRINSGWISADYVKLG